MGADLEIVQDARVLSGIRPLAAFMCGKGSFPASNGHPVLRGRRRRRRHADGRACADQRRRRSVRPDCARFPALDDLDEFRDLAEVVHLEVGENRRQRNAGLVTDELGVVFGLVLVRRRIAEDCLLEGELDVGGRSQQGDDRRLPALLVGKDREAAVIADGAAIDREVALADIAGVAITPGARAAFADFVTPVRVGIKDRFRRDRAGVDEGSMRACWRRGRAIHVGNVLGIVSLSWAPSDAEGKGS